MSKRNQSNADKYWKLLRSGHCVQCGRRLDSDPPDYASDDRVCMQCYCESPEGVALLAELDR